MTNTLRGVPVHDGFKFHWRGRVGTTEASDLGDLLHARLHSDSCDVGFYVRSHRTGAVKAFTLVAGPEDSDGEVMEWTYEASDGARIVVFND